MDPEQTHYGPVHQYLSKDHDRLGDLLNQALAADAPVESAAYKAFRAGLLRHIGLEERLLFPPARRTGDAAVQSVVARLHQEHALFSAMLVLTPTVELLAELRDLLGDHNQREEGPAGIYQFAEQLAGTDVDRLAADLRAGAEARLAPHYDTELARQNINVLRRALSPT